MPFLKRAVPLIALAALGAGAQAVPATAASDQEAIFQDGPSLRADPVGTLATLKRLGAGRLRLLVPWNTVAPAANSHRKPRGFRSADPSAYPATNWSIYDTIVRTALADGIAVDLDLTGPAPLWATGPGAPPGGPYGQWKPSAGEFNGFVKAVGTRYSGHYHGLPRVGFWSIWNEPNYGIDLAPQATNHDTIEVGAWSYRNIVDAAWSALNANGHRGDTILIGETAPRGLDHPIGNFSGVKPLRFLRALYCVDSHYRQLRGSAASARGCPTAASGSRRFRSAHPGLFSASGFADHPYAQGVAPNQPTTSNPRRFRSDPDYADFPEIGRVEGVLDRLQSSYGSRTRFPIWSTEYGYWTNPPERVAKVTPATAAYYINWAEYLSWRQPRVYSYAQYLLADPPLGNFASGLEFNGGRPKVTFDAYRLPLYMPSTSAARGRSLEVWGAVRPAHLIAGQQQVQIQFQAGSHGAFSAVKTVTVANRRGYFDLRQTFTGSGSVRLAWSYPSGETVYSRTVRINVR